MGKLKQLYLGIEEYLDSIPNKSKEESIQDIISIFNISKSTAEYYYNHYIGYTNDRP